MTDILTKTDLIIESLQMGMDSHAASIILTNARIEMLASHIGLDVSHPPLTKGEERNKDFSLKSASERAAKIIKAAAEMDGHEAPSPEEIEAFINKLKHEGIPEGGSPYPPTQPDNPQKTGEEERVNRFPQSDPFKGTAFEGAQPVYPAAAKEDTIPEFKTTRAGVKIDPEKVFTVHVFEQDSFEDVDFSDPESRKACWNTIVKFHSQAARKAVKDKWLSQPWADRLCQEFSIWPERQGTGEDQTLSGPTVSAPLLTLPSPSDITNNVAQSAANGDAEISVKDMTDESQVVEALMTAFVISVTRFDIKTIYAVLCKRLAQLGF